MTRPPYLDELHATLDQRWRPEDVLTLIVRGEPGELAPRVGSRRPLLYSSMSSDFARPVDGARVLASVERATQEPVPAVDPTSADELRSASALIGAPIAWTPEQEDSETSTHLTRAQRAEAGIDLSRRQYNRRWRALRRLHRKSQKLATEQKKRDLLIIGRSGFVSRIDLDRFVADPAAAHFVAYWVARKNLRRQFSLDGRTNPMDDVARRLLGRCETNPTTDWEMIAWARPTPDVLTRLSDDQRGRLLADWVVVMRRAAALLAAAWDPSNDRTTMIVRRGQDSSTWNTIAQAYNSARAGWLACVSALGAEPLLDAACPGKAMRLMAADLAYWHRATGSSVDPNTAVWATLPLPWEVLDGNVECSADTVAAACRAVDLDPRDSGWTAPRPPGDVVAFTPTPELVHGVTIADPIWAGLLRRAGVFSGQRITTDPDLRTAAAAGLAGGVVASDLPAYGLGVADEA